MQLSRRSFVKAAAAFAASWLGALSAACGSQARTREPLRQFGYAQVQLTGAQLTGGPLAEHYDALHAHYLSLSNDRLLKVYRERAGLPAPGADMGGWYDPEGLCAGATVWASTSSGLARFGACTGDAACHDKVHDAGRGFCRDAGAERTRASCGRRRFEPVDLLHAGQALRRDDRCGGT